MLDVALGELPRGGPKHVLTREVSPGHREGHHVLKLIAKAVGAAGLIERRPRPDATGERLVEQPAVEQHVHGPVRRRHLDRAEHVVPTLLDSPQGPIEVGRPVPRDQSPRFFPGRRLAEEEHDLGPSAGGQLDQRLEGTARVEAGADPSREPAAALERRRVIGCAVTPEECRPVTRPRRLNPAQVGKRHASAEVTAKAVAHEHRARIRVDLGDDERCGGAP